MLSHVAPHICCSCAEYGYILCESCKENIIGDDFGQCIWCTHPVPDMHLCAQCRKRTGLAAAWSVGERKDALKQIINDYKFESKREASRVLAELVDITLPVLPNSTVVTWVPTAPSHIRQRGFDHAAMLATEFANRRKLTALSTLKRKNSVSQHELSRAKRLEAARQAFAITTEIDRPILLIDDVMTTGATLQACTRLLRQHSQTVYVAVIARQLSEK